MLKRALYRDTDGAVADLVGNGVAADAVGFTPAGSIAATDVQAAIEEVASEAGGSFVPDPSGQPDNKWLKTASGALVYTDPPSGATFGTPAIVLGTAAAAGSTDEAIRRDSTIVAFDTTAPTTQAFGDAAAVGTAGVAARRDHKHAMPAAPSVAADIHAATSKTTPVDADELGLVDTEASNVLKKLTGTNLKAYLKAYFDTLYSGASTSRKTYLNKPAGNITRNGTTVAAFSTAWQIASVVVAAGQNVKLTMSCNSIASTANADQLFAFFRDSTQIAARSFTSSGSSAHNGREFTWIDENPGAGTYTYEIRAAMFTSGTLTVYQTNPTTDVGQGSAVFIAEVYTP